jgi:hypothetical protein
VSLAAALAELDPDHRPPASSEPLLRDFLLSLYGKCPGRIWSENVQPFLKREQRALQVLYEEHRAFPEAAILDFAESLLVLERLQHDSARLYAGWPLAPSQLDVVAHAWGIVPAHAA